VERLLSGYAKDADGSMQTDDLWKEIMLDAKLYSTGELDAISDALSQSGYICDLKEMFGELFFVAKEMKT